MTVHLDFVWMVSVEPIEVEFCVESAITDFKTQGLFVRVFFFLSFFFLSILILIVISIFYYCASNVVFQNVTNQMEEKLSDTSFCYGPMYLSFSNFEFRISIP